MKPIWLGSMAALLVFAASIAACARSAVDNVGQPELAGVTLEPGSLDSTFARLAVDLPGFAGIYTDDTQTLHLKLVAGASTDRAKAAAALERVGLLPAGGGRDARILLETSNTRHSWSDLMAYKTAARDVLTLPGVTSLDADEVAGVITVGVAETATRDAVEKFMAAANLPADAWRMIPSAYRQRYQSLTDQFRPLVGGTQIKNDAGPFAFVGFAGVCTLTMTGLRSGLAGFITNSHCTRVQGGTEGTNYFQSGRTIFNLDYVSHEGVDPNWTASLSGCPTGSLCRRSDAAYTVVDIGNQNAALAVIARPATLCVGTAPCSTALGSPTARITVTGVSGPLLAGAFVSKVGRTTGWTGGLVSATCVDTGQLGTSFVVLCQTDFGGGGAPGDSGSPVIIGPTATPSGTTPVTATIAGLLWGGTSAVSTFSPISAALAELGGISLFPPSDSSGPAPPPSACVQACRVSRDKCMKSVGGLGNPRPQECVADLWGCLAQC